MESRETINSLGDKDHVGDVEIEMEETDVLDNPVSGNNPPTNATVRPATTPSVKRKKVPQKSYEESLLHILKQKRDEDREIDEDKYFLLSLLPSFKKMNEDQKFFVRTEFLNVMRRVRFSGNNYPIQSGHNVNLLYGCGGSTSLENNTGQYFSTFTPNYQTEGTTTTTPVLSVSPNTQTSWENDSEASSRFTL